MTSRLSGVRGTLDAVLLVVEDDADILEAVLDLLNDAGHNVRAARTLAEARAFVAHTTPAALVLDLNLPDGSSDELLVELAAARRSVPAVILTAATNGLEIARRHGAAYVKKPFAIDELLDVVDSLLGIQSVGSAR